MQPTGGADFLAFLEVAVARTLGGRAEILDNLSTHSTAEIMTWVTENPNLGFHFTPVGSSWINQISVNPPWTSGLARAT